MSGKESGMSLVRRLFLTRLGLGAGVLGATVVGANAALASVSAALPAANGAAALPAAPASPADASGSWKPARHEQDDWYDQIPGQHRFLIDTDNGEAMAWGLRFGNNYFTANVNAYGLKESDLAVIIVARHRSTSFGYNNAMWAKYGKYFSEQAEFVDPKTKEAPALNVYLTADGDQPAPIDDMVKKGAHFAVCGMSSRAIAGRVAKGTGGKADDILKELTSNLVPNARIVPAGILAVSRGQERGYTLATVV
jgi:intracellular sulfur oxidation DsrE/DsrF family protein